MIWWYFVDYILHLNHSLILLYLESMAVEFPLKICIGKYNLGAAKYFDK